MCRSCGKWIQNGEPCERWAGGRAAPTPECLDYTVVHKWDEGDWECAAWESEMERPAEKRQCFMCRKESSAWIALETRPRYVCSVECLHNYANAIDMT